MTAKKEPIAVDTKPGENYVWCACGKSADQPFCDGAHKADKSLPKPLPYKAETDKTVWFCTCKQTQTPPFCDGSHSKI